MLTFLFMITMTLVCSIHLIKNGSNNVFTIGTLVIISVELLYSLLSYKSRFDTFLMILIAFSIGCGIDAIGKNGITNDIGIITVTSASATFIASFSV